MFGGLCTLVFVERLKNYNIKSFEYFALHP